MNSHWCKIEEAFPEQKQKEKATKKKAELEIFPIIHNHKCRDNPVIATTNDGNRNQCCVTCRKVLMKDGVNVVEDIFSMQHSSCEVYD